MCWFKNNRSFIKRLWFFTGLSLFLWGCSGDESATILGTLERDRITLRATASEIITEVSVEQGMMVQPGQKILQLDNSKQLMAVSAAEADVKNARARLNELKNGARPEEIAAARAQVNSQKAGLLEAEKNYERTATLVKKNMLTDADLDAAVAKRDTFTANLENARQNLQLLLSGTREEVIRQAKAALLKAEATRTREVEQLNDLTLYATRHSWLDSLPRKQGERVTAGEPLAIMLVDELPYARVYIPEPLRIRVAINDILKVYVDGIDPPLEGRVRWLSLDPAFTPHYALNEKERARLVYMAEIELPESARTIPAGIPVQVGLPL